MKKIIFGAGDYGRKAICFYGSENVAFFADNNPERIGAMYEGKKIVSPMDLPSLAKTYEIIIAVNQNEAVVQQFSDLGITNYSVFYPELAANVLIRDKLLNNADKKIVFFNYRDDLSDADAELIIISDKKYHLAAELKAKRLFWMGPEVFNPFAQRNFYPNTPLVINNCYDAKGIDQTENEFNRSRKEAVEKTDFCEKICAYMDEASAKVPLFKYVELETINWCNGVCEFCPVNKNLDIRDKKIMPDDLFFKIINDLSKISYSGHFSLFSNNEPLLDKRIVDFSRYAREKLPNSYIWMFTNGSLLTLGLFKRLIECVDELIIDNYTENLKLIKPVKEIVDYVENEEPELSQKVTVSVISPKEIRTTRGGNAPNRKEMVSYSTIPCAMPFQQMVIRPDGKLSLCCNDPYGKHTLGDLSVQTVMEAWNSDEYSIIREAIKSGRGALKSCVHCDYFRLE